MEWNELFDGSGDGEWMVTIRAIELAADGLSGTATAGGGIEAEGEDIEVLELTLVEALAAVDSGQIVDGKTIMLLYHLALKGIL